AHLAGAVAAHTTLPVIGVPLAATDLSGMDALLATVQMPAGIPVATVAVGKPGAKNAALLAVQILSLTNSELAKVLESYKIKLAESCQKKNEKLQEKLKKS
ncbi:MAG TPA: 5-(carboxyamino)imidazole ribonucleotide mutase, partial [Candidatus Omnitrophota bacterium]|nr:5-(carboxyamino)imidazole ribonucleotide mutase [Candidatus Omnitrophota bacterium]